MDLNGYIYSKIIVNNLKCFPNNLDCSSKKLESVLEQSITNLKDGKNRDFGSEFTSQDTYEPSCHDTNFSCSANRISENDLKLLATANFSNETSYINKFLEDSTERIVHRQFVAEEPFFNSSKNSINNNLLNKGTIITNSGNAPKEKNNSKDTIKSQSSRVDGFFRTAREELILQNIKKNGNNNLKQENNSILSSSQLPLFNYGATKKTLGARRNVRSKFVPPIMSNNNNSDEPLQNVEEKDGGITPSPSEDARFANIDPKMIELISNEIMHKYKSVDWNDIAGLEYPKSIIKEAVVYPLLRPDLFTGLRRPPRGILLFGPPGTGKTLIGKCIASKSKSTFFSISASSLTSKYVGDSEKMVRALFAVAAVNQPSVVFIDEIDSMLSQRSESEHESTRRLKTEFLVQFDGVGSTTNDRILIVGATNRPQELDDAARRRFVKRLYIPLPEFEARLQILKNLLQTVKNDVNEMNLKVISEKADGFSGADMESLCCEASMNPIRAIPEEHIPFLSEDAVRPVNLSDFEIALQKVRPSVSKNDLTQYVEWNLIYGAEH